MNIHDLDRVLHWTRYIHQDGVGQSVQPFVTSHLDEIF